MKLACDSGSLPSFADHLAPIWLALPDEVKDGFYARGRAAARAKELGIEVDGVGQARQKELVLVASYEDHRRAGQAKTILLNHGAGQTYTGDPDAADHPSYSGGRDRSRVSLFLCPSERDAEVCRVAGGRAVAVGSPRLDAHHGLPVKQRSDPPVVAISFHSDVHVCSETRSAFAHYQQAIIDVARDPNCPFDLLGHGHPRWGEFMAKFWKRIGVPFARHFDEVLEKADLYACDNSSTLYEFASTNRPVLVLNAPWYRRNVEHGLRFWSGIPGVQISRGTDFVQGVEWAMSDDPMVEDARRDGVRAAYGDLCDGQATRRAVDAIVGLLNGR